MDLCIYKLTYGFPVHTENKNVSIYFSLLYFKGFAPVERFSKMGGIICLWIRTWLLLLALVFLLSANYVLSVKEMSRKWQRIKNTFLTTDVGAKRLSYPDIPLEECLIEKCMLGKLDLTCTAVNYNTKTNECVLPILDGYTSGLNYMELDDWTYWEWGK